LGKKRREKNKIEIYSTWYVGPTYKGHFMHNQYATSTSRVGLDPFGSKWHPKQVYRNNILKVEGLYDTLYQVEEPAINFAQTATSFPKGTNT